MPQFCQICWNCSLGPETFRAKNGYIYCYRFISEYRTISDNIGKRFILNLPVVVNPSKQMSEWFCKQHQRQTLLDKGTNRPRRDIILSLGDSFHGDAPSPTAALEGAARPEELSDVSLGDLYRGWSLFFPVKRYDGGSAHVFLTDIKKKKGWKEPKLHNQSAPSAEPQHVECLQWRLLSGRSGTRCLYW